MLASLNDCVSAACFCCSQSLLETERALGGHPVVSLLMQCVEVPDLGEGNSRHLVVCLFSAFGNLSGDLLWPGGVKSWVEGGKVAWQMHYGS